MRLERLHPAPHVSVDLGSPDAATAIEDLYRPPRERWLRLNLVTSVDGSAIGPDGTSDTLTSGADRRILGVIRRLADLVLVGAASVRAEGYVMPRTAGLAVLTASGELTGHRFDPELAPGRLTIVTGVRGAERARETLAGVPAEVVVLEGERPTHHDIVDALRARGFEHIVCEGGPELAGQLIDAGVVDELCLSTSPRLSGALLPPLPVARARDLELTQLLRDDADVLYARWAV